MSGRPKRERAIPTAAESLSRLVIDIARLRAEIQQLRAFRKDAGPVPERLDSIYMHDRPTYRRGETRGTIEPKNQTRQALDEIGTESDDAAQMKAIRAIAADIDGAFMDLRAMRTMLEEILDHPESKARLRTALNGKRR